MLKSEFIKEIKDTAVLVRTNYGKYMDKGGDPANTWSVPGCSSADNENTREYFESYFFDEFLSTSDLHICGGPGDIYIPHWVERMRYDKLEITYNSSGKMAVMQYVSFSGEVKVRYFGYTSDRGWENRTENNKNMAKFVSTVKPLGTSMPTEITFKVWDGMTAPVIRGSVITAPKDGFTISPTAFTEFKLLEVSSTSVKYHIKLVYNDMGKMNYLMEITLKDGEVKTKETHVKEDWWGMQIPDCKLPYFGKATPYNMVLHEYMNPPEYAGEHVWVTEMGEGILVKIGNVWIPVYDPENWDMGTLFSKEVGEEYDLYKSLK